MPNPVGNYTPNASTPTPSIYDPRSAGSRYHAMGDESPAERMVSEMERRMSIPYVVGKVVGSFLRRLYNSIPEIKFPVAEAAALDKSDEMFDKALKSMKTKVLCEESVFNSINRDMLAAINKALSAMPNGLERGLFIKKLKSRIDEIEGAALPERADYIALALANGLTKDSATIDRFVSLIKESNIEISPRVSSFVKERKSAEKAVKKEFMAAALEGPKTRDLIMECLGVANIAVIHQKHAPDHYRSAWFTGLYQAESDEITLKRDAIGRFGPGTLIHECGHRRERVEGITYDFDLIERCSKNFRQMLAGMIECFNGKNKEQICQFLQEQALRFGKRDVSHVRPMETKDGLVRIGTSSPNDLDVPRFRRDMAPVIQVRCFAEGVGERYCIEGLVGFKDALDGMAQNDFTKMVAATEDEKALFNAIANLAAIHSLENMRKLYKADDYVGLTGKESDEMFIAELRQRFAVVPEGVIDDVCPEGFGDRFLSDSPAQIVARPTHESLAPRRVPKHEL